MVIYNQVKKEFLKRKWELMLIYVIGKILDFMTFLRTTIIVII